MPGCFENPSLICLYPYTGSQSVHSEALPEDAPYLLLEDLHYNQTHSNTHSLTHSNSVKHALTDPHCPTETQAETLSATGSETHIDPQVEIHPDMLTVTDTHSVAHTETGTNSDTHTAILVKLQQVSAVHAANTERYEGTAVE